MTTITINIDEFNENNAADACIEVANLIKEGYTNGILVNGESWEIDK